MTETKQQLLAVLDMSEKEQWVWITEGDRVIEYFPDDEIFIGDPQKYLADLAFRLRDEAVKSSHADFHEAIYDIMIKVEGNDNWATAFWGECIAKPIHWIIAALIAKESK